jgi:hypothetical protein
MTTLPSVVTAIIVSNVLLSVLGFKNQPFFNKYQFQMAKIKAGEQIRMWSSGFLHVDFNHLFVNMLSLYFFAGYVVYSLGEMKFLALYLTSLYLGNYLSFRYHNKQDNYTGCRSQWGCFRGSLQCCPFVSRYENDDALFSNPPSGLCHGRPVHGLYHLWDGKTKR